MKYTDFLKTKEVAAISRGLRGDKGSQDMLEKLGDRFTKLQEDFLKLGIVLEQNTIEQLVEFSYTLNSDKSEAIPVPI